MHERSETVMRGRRAVNVYGKGTDKEGQVLKPLFPYEADDYASLEEADKIAGKRSDDFGRALDSSLQRHGAFRRLMEETAGPSWTRPR